MDTGYLNLLNETFSDPSKFTIENLKGFVNETVRFFSDMKERLSSEDVKIKEEALSFSLEVKKVLEDKMDALCKQAGISPDQLGLLSENPDNMNSEEYAFVQSAKDQLGVFAAKDRKRLKNSDLRLYS